MKTPPEAAAEARAQLTQIRDDCEKCLRHQAALVKKLGTEAFIMGKITKRVAFYEEKIAANPDDEKAATDLHGYKLQVVLLSATIQRGEAKLAEELAKAELLMGWAAVLLADLAVEAPEALAAAGDLGTTEAPLAELQKMIAVMTAILGDTEERAEAERRAKRAKWHAEYLKQLNARQDGDRGEPVPPLKRGLIDFSR